MMKRDDEVLAMGTVDKKKIKILLIQAPFKELGFGREWQPSESLAPPLGLMYLASPLIKESYSVNFIDLNIESFEEQEFLDRIRDQDFLLISVFSHSLVNAKKIINTARTVNKNAFIVCGGPYCNLTRNFIEGADMIVVGEAEGCIHDILDRVLCKKTLKGIPGLVYRKNGKIVRNPGVLHVGDINRSVNSFYQLARDKNYGCFFGHKIKGVAGVMSSRGCTFKCTYCTHKGVIKYRARSIDNVMDELKDLKSKGYKYIVFYDDNFFMNKKRAIELMDRVIEEKLKLKFVFQGRIDSIDYGFYKKLRRAGVTMIMFGIENANQDVLDFYQKGITVERVKEVIRLCKKAGIIVVGYFIIGSPLEDEEHFKVNKEFIDHTALDYVHVNILGYPQGSKIWEDAVKTGLIKENEASVRANETLSQYSLDQWREMKAQLVKGFYTRPSRITRLAYKALRSGVLPDLLKILWHAKKDFLLKGKSPYYFTEKAKINA